MSDEKVVPDNKSTADSKATAESEDAASSKSQPLESMASQQERLSHNGDAMPDPEAQKM